MTSNRLNKLTLGLLTYFNTRLRCLWLILLTTFLATLIMVTIANTFSYTAGARGQLVTSWAWAVSRTKCGPNWQRKGENNKEAFTTYE